MSEDQQTPVQQADAAATPETETIDTTVTAVNEAPEQEQANEENPAEVKVFGISRSCFHGAALGVAVGFLVSGFAGVLFHVDLNPSASVIICALIGYLISSQLERRRKQNDSQSDR